MSGLGGTGGNWKDTVHAAGNGNLKVLQHHLSQGVDPFFQHPEYFTAPIFEAIRKGQLEAVQLLVQHDANMLNMTEDMTDSTPLEVAFTEKQHAIVNYLLTQRGQGDSDKKSRLPSFIKTVALIGSFDLVSDPTTMELVRIVADAGHRVALVVASMVAKTAAAVQDAAKQVQRTTGNPHVYVVERSTAALFPVAMDHVDIWIGQGDCVGFLADSTTAIQKSLQSCSKILWCTTDTRQTDEIRSTFPIESVSIITTAGGWFSYFLGQASLQAADIYWLALEGETNHVYTSGRIDRTSKSQGNDWLGL